MAGSNNTSRLAQDGSTGGRRAQSPPLTVTSQPPDPIIYSGIQGGGLVPPTDDLGTELAGLYSGGLTPIRGGPKLPDNLPKSPKGSKP